ncbi:kelch-like protein 10 [Gigantopelta aegis]|uniref:kelch-like protein 10 n=1 Tax=Gigantopelta aegis TaxID=1735272 RepID=UPI001B88AAE7|nr:kelch-like protein 10 [Gigantopelta aegis]
MNAQQQKLLDGLNDLLHSEELTDVTLMADDAEFQCHRNVLAASSPYFRAMFTADVRENRQKIIPIHGVSKKALGIAVKFMYTGTADITNDNVQVLITASNLFQLETLLGACADYMMKEICMENCFDVYDFAELHCLPALREEAKLFILEHFVELFQNELNLKKTDKSKFSDLISDDEVNVEKEEVIYQILVRWVDADRENRAASFPSLFGHVRLALMNRDFISSEIDTNPLVANNPFCKSMISVAKIYNLAKMSGADWKLAGMFKTKMLIFSGGTRTEEQRSFSCFDPETNKNYYGIEPDPPHDCKFKISRYKLAVTRDSNIFFLGGELCKTDISLALDSVYRYVPKLRNWERCRSMHSARCSFPVAVTGDRIYVFGGSEGHKDVTTPLNAVEFYETEDDEWQIVSPMPVAIFNQAACMYQEDVFIFGGQHSADGETQYLDTVLKYSLGTDTWTLVTTEMVNPRARCSSILFKDQIYVIGGCSKYQNILSVDIYNPVKNTWKFGKDFPEQRTTLAETQFDDVIYVIGGRVHLPVLSRSGSRRTIEAKDLYKYDPDSDEWTKVVKLIPHASFEICTTALVDTQFLKETGFISGL